MAIRPTCPADNAGIDRSNPRRVLWIVCGTHALHDGFTDALYVLLPVWQAEFALSYAAVGVLRALYTVAMAGLQLPSAMSARWIGRPVMLAAGTALAAGEFLFASVGSGVVCLAAALVLSSIGSSAQHPVERAYAASAGSRRNHAARESRA
jgi:MFS transporter, FSR family, fosmidomycin resistance protein